MKTFQWVVGIVLAGLVAWIVSVFPNLAAALIGSIVTVYVTRAEYKFTNPTPRFWAMWLRRSFLFVNSRGRLCSISANLFY